jgi:hypothetical protein
MALWLNGRISGMQYSGRNEIAIMSKGTICRRILSTWGLKPLSRQRDGNGGTPSGGLRIEKLT